MNPAEIVDLRSDTVTRPDAAMRAAIAGAEVGDHVLGDDPTAAELEHTMAELLRKEAALFFPSGIMANQAAILVQAPPGTEVVLDAGAHILNYEEGAAAAWSGAQLRGVLSEDGFPTADAYASAIRAPSRYLPVTSMLCLENTHNVAGGRVLAPERMAAVVEVARSRGLAVHLDGARLPNAAIASGREMWEWSVQVDTVMVSLSKGLGAPIGSVLAGPAALMDSAWRVRRRLGGGMRQVGLLAAAALYGLRNNLSRLAEDHRRARALAEGIRGLPGLRCAPPETNIVMIDLHRDLPLDTADLLATLDAGGVRMVSFGPRRVRAVTHLDVSDAGIARAVHALREAVAAA
jgi:threonine aldolase